jgi:hypothetical protein
MCAKTGGEFNPCAGCEAVYHFDCIELNDSALEDEQFWFCPICRKNQVLINKTIKKLHNGLGTWCN